MFRGLYFALSTNGELPWGLSQHGRWGWNHHRNQNGVNLSARLVHRFTLRKLDVRCVARCWSCTRWSFTSVWKPRKSRRRNMQCASMHDGVCVLLHVFGYIPSPPSFPPYMLACIHCMHACITLCTHTYTYMYTNNMHQTYSTYIDILYTYTYLHIHPYTSIYIHIHACACIPIYIYMDHKDLRYIHTDPCAPVNGARKLFDHTSGQFQSAWTPRFVDKIFGIEISEAQCLHLFTFRTRYMIYIIGMSSPKFWGQFPCTSAMSDVIQVGEGS